MRTLSENAIQILEERYLLKDPEGRLLENPEQMFRRVARAVSEAESENLAEWEKRYFNLMNELLFLPNSPTLMNAGLPQGQLSACFVIPIDDSLTSIFGSLKTAALVHQSGGGTGFDFSQLRPKNDLVSSTVGSSSGPVAFLRIYDCATEYVKQGGKRRGANMGILRIDHPDIVEFIEAKSKGESLQNFNLSIAITDAFMNARLKDEDFALVNPRNGKKVKTLRASYLWELIVQKAWETGDPGLIFIDTINKQNPTPSLGPISSTNPCGEVPLLPFESCNLGSINLSKMLVAEDKKKIDWEKLSQTIALSIRFLDNVISINNYLLPEIRKITQANRKVGLGIMGWAELLIQLGIPYASDRAVDLGSKLMQFIRKESYRASEMLAGERGNFPNWEKSVHYPHRPMRNASCNSIAPTGTISVIANTSYSIEPLFGLAVKRTGILGNKTQFELNRLFEAQMKDLGTWTPSVKKQLLNGASIREIQGVPERIRPLYLNSLEIHWAYHLRHQRAFQRHTDNAVSKTINLPYETSPEEISEIYDTAWNYKLKGITIFRNGCKSAQVLQNCNLGSSSCS